MKHIKYSILKPPGEYINYNVRDIDCLMMNRGQHVTVEKLLPFCAGCDMMQGCRPWLKVDDISRAEFEKANVS
jgi:hypothetical protein